MVYILHLKKNLGHARHYVGYAENVQSRLWHHRHGSGANFTRVCNERGIKYVLAAILEGDRKVERKLKKLKNIKFYCPICSREKTRRVYRSRETKIPIQILFTKGN